MAVALRQQLRNESSDKSAAIDHEFWCILNTDGLCKLFMLKYFWLCTQKRSETKAGKVVYLEHVLMINAGIEIKVTSTFYPEVMMLTMDERSSYILMQPRIPNEEGVENCD
ncbi:hypothetical protein VTP01DRAFT_3234 [Rhizomucor pusillus]|uniref:uncharacterized protein n=1 Tax=Rhizomucor pusillus TaxID=4840 RepID=UPI003741EAFE